MNKIFFAAALLYVLVLVSPAFAEEMNVTENALNAITEAEVILGEIEDAGFGSSFFEDRLLDAKDAFENKDYGSVLDAVDDISQRRERAFKIYDAIEALKFRAAELQKVNVDVSKTVELLDLAKSVFKKEIFDDAESLIFRAENELDDLEAKSSKSRVILASARDNIVSYVRQNWTSLSAGFFVLLVIGFVIYVRWFLVSTQKKIEDLKIKKNILNDLIKKTENLYYQEQKIGKEEFELTEKNFKNDLTEIQGIIPVFEEKIRRVNARISAIIPFYGKHASKKNIEPKQGKNSRKSYMKNRKHASKKL